MIKEKICHYLPGDMGGGVLMKKETNGDIGGKGSKIWHFHGDVIFEWPLKMLQTSHENICVEVVSNTDVFL